MKYVFELSFYLNGCLELMRKSNEVARRALVLGEIYIEVY